MNESKHEDRRDDNRLAEAIELLARVLYGLGKRNNNNAILDRVEEMERKIMKEIQDFATANDAKLAAIEAAIDALPVAGIADDVAYLKEVIAGMEGNAALTEEDKASLAAGLARADALLVKVETFNAALKALDDATTRPVTPPPVE